MNEPTSGKYPRTWHLPWSPGGTNDDKRLTRDEVASDFLMPGKEYVITEKMDGSNLTMTRQCVYARSHAGPPAHRSFTGAKALHAAIAHNIDRGLSVFGEWLYAKHSIEYTALPSEFMLFAVRDDRTGLWYDWDNVTLCAHILGVETAPVLWRGYDIANTSDLERITTAHATGASTCGPEREGVVVRHAGEFYEPDFRIRVAKLVRADHVQTDQHWKDQEIVRNGVLSRSRHGSRSPAL